MRTGQLHVLIVNVAVGVDVIAEVGVIGDLAQVSLDIVNKAVTGRINTFDISEAGCN